VNVGHIKSRCVNVSYYLSDPAVIQELSLPKDLSLIVSLEMRCTFAEAPPAESQNQKAFSAFKLPTLPAVEFEHKLLQQA
jgi:hypothetical protein